MTLGNGLYWVANVLVISKTDAYIVEEALFKKWNKPFYDTVLGFCEIKYSDRAVSEGILRFAHITKIL